MPTRISETELVAALTSLADELGRPPTRDEMEADGEYSATPYYRRFGSWPAALERAGLEPQYRHTIPDEELRAALRDLADDLGRVPRRRDMATRGPFAPSTYRRRFGSWTAALDQAGFDPDTHSAATRVDQAELLRALHQLTRQLGRPPTQSDMQTDGPYSVDIYHDRFGSWTAALDEANLTLE